jgi:hypothetical protein
VTRPKVFISWAHTRRDWTTERTLRWEQTVAEFARLLDACGVEVRVDLFDYTTRGVDWTRYGTRAIEWADTVLMVSSEPYWERWSGHNAPDEGAGVAREADALHGLFDADQHAFQQKALIVELPGESAAVPPDLSRVPRYVIRAITEAGLEALLLLFSGQSRYRPGDSRRDEVVAAEPASPAAPFGLPAKRAELLARQREEHARRRKPG